MRRVVWARFHYGQLPRLVLSHEKQKTLDSMKKDPNVVWAMAASASGHDVNTDQQRRCQGPQVPLPPSPLRIFTTDLPVRVTSDWDLEVISNAFWCNTYP